jgi:hypothetical protein
VISFAPQPLYPQGKSLWDPLDRKLIGPQSRSGHGVGKEKFPAPVGNRTAMMMMMITCSYYKDYCCSVHIPDAHSWETAMLRLILEKQHCDSVSRNNFQIFLLFLLFLVFSYKYESYISTELYESTYFYIIIIVFFLMLYFIQFKFLTHEYSGFFIFKIKFP